MQRTPESVRTTGGRSWDSRFAIPGSLPCEGQSFRGSSAAECERACRGAAGKAAHAVNVPFVVPRTAPLVGAPQLRLTYSGSAPAGVRPTRIFAQLVDDSTGIVMGNQITPIAVTLDGRSHTIAVPLEMVAFTAKPNAHLTLQLVATTTAYGQPRLGGSVTFSSIQLELPAVTDVSRS